MPETVFLDTNILVYSRDEASPFFDQTCEALRGLASNEVRLVTYRQVLREYASVATRPPPRGLGVTHERALQDIEEFEDAYELLDDPEPGWELWKELVRTNNVTGLRVHDANIAAVMRGHGISHIVTLNVSDFRDFDGIQPFTPENWEDIISS